VAANRDKGEGIETRGQQEEEVSDGGCGGSRPRGRRRVRQFVEVGEQHLDDAVGQFRSDVIGQFGGDVNGKFRRYQDRDCRRPYRCHWYLGV
jgi:hypothetical protein